MYAQYNFATSDAEATTYATLGSAETDSTGGIYITNSTSSGGTGGRGLLCEGDAVASLSRGSDLWYDRFTGVSDYVLKLVTFNSTASVPSYTTIAYDDATAFDSFMGTSMGDSWTT